MYLQKAADKLMVQYYQPKEGELFYYLGLAQKELGKEDLAYRNFSQSTWYYEWRSSGFYELALMESNKGNYSKALEFIEKAYSTNTLDGRISILYSGILRKLGKHEKALDLIEKLINFDPINFVAYYEKDLITGNDILSTLQGNMQDVDNNYLEIAVNYMNVGMLDEGIALLSSLENPSNPLVNYYLAWFYDKSGQKEKANEQLAVAGSKSVDYCFPYREETVNVLEYAIEHSANNAVPYYLLGNLLYDRRPQDAINFWDKALKTNDNFALVWRNLAFGAFYHENNVNKAVDYLKRAIELDGGQPIWYAELETYFDQSDKDFTECLDILDDHIDVLKKDINAPKSLVKLYNLNGDYDKAINLLENHHFRTWEGGRVIYYHYVDAHTLQALELMKQGEYKLATSELEKAMEYPENLEVGKPLNDERNAMIYYFMGLAYEKMSEMSKAKDCFHKSVIANNSRDWQDLLYYQAKSYEKLGDMDKAREIFEKLVKEGNERLEKGVIGTGIGVEESLRETNKSMSEAYYLKALGLIGLDNARDAMTLFDKAIKSYKNNLWAKIHMESDK